MLVRCKNGVDATRHLGDEDLLWDRLDVRPVETLPLPLVGITLTGQLVANADLREAVREREARLLEHLSDGSLGVALLPLWSSADPLPEAAPPLCPPEEQEVDVPILRTPEEMDEHLARHTQHPMNLARRQTDQPARSEPSTTGACEGGRLGRSSRGRLTRVETVARVRGVTEQLLRDGTAVARSDGTRHALFPVAITAAEGRALRDWVRRESATRTLEVGLGYGISTLHICEALLERGGADACHVAIDPHQSTRFADCALQFLEDAGISDRVEL